MLNKFNSLKVKAILIFLVFFLLILGTAFYLFSNIMKDREYNARVQYYSINSQKVQNFRATIIQTISHIYTFNDDKDNLSKEKYLRLSHILNNQFETMLNNSIQSSGARKVFISIFQTYSRIKDLADQMFETKDEVEQKQILQRIRFFEGKMMESLDQLSDNVYQEASIVFKERSQNYEKLLYYYVLIIIFIVFIGFTYLVIFFRKNVTNPLKEFLKAIRQLENGDFTYQTKVKANNEFDALAKVFNEMTGKIHMLTDNLKEKNNRLEAIVNTPAVGVIILDKDHQTIYENKWAKTRFSDNNKIKYLREVNQSEEIYFKKSVDQNFETFIFEDEDNDGNKYECFINKVENEKLLLLFDITEKNKLEEDLKHYVENIEVIVGEKTRELNQAYKELEIKNIELTTLDQMKTQFLQNISHELRTPLTSIIGYLDVVLNYHNIPPTQRSFLQIALQNSLSLLKIINDLLNITEIESGYMKLHLANVDIKKVLENIIDQISIQFEQKEVKLEFVVDKKAKADMFEMVIDEMKIQSVFNNILSNAIKFTRQGSVTISLTADKDQVIVEIKDTGIGIKEEDLKLIFDKFRQVDNSISRAYDGAGLGLPIAKKLLELLRSDITVESKVGVGSTFTVSLKKVFSL